LCRVRSREGEAVRHKIRPVDREESSDDSEDGSDTELSSFSHAPLAQPRIRGEIDESQLIHGDRVEVSYFMEDIQAVRWFRGTVNRFSEKYKGISKR